MERGRWRGRVGACYPLRARRSAVVSLRRLARCPPAPAPPSTSPPPASLLEPAGAAPPAARCSPSPSPSPCACSAAPTVDTPKLLGPLPLALPHSQHGSGEAARGKAIRQASPMQGAMMGLGMVATPGGAATQFAVSAARSGSLQRGPGHKPRARDTGHPRHFARGTGRGRHVRAAPGGRHAASELDPPLADGNGSLVSAPGANGKPTGAGLGHGCTRCTGGRNEIGQLPSTPQ